ncbi:succinylglutamate desuccinylase/aspartoacylase family protein [Alicyclobacillus fastidiosus]|uniref:Succinylglutamate desuccinylase/aspartoacylase family protein n=1 Tax=Alicyclobacillus fastidiosus TaxID=392011 RepID=A0ABV5ABZ5_9BACL|nr:succinylglutamate desuccinylase/aspartoacylase family protein [Alicyclobacillus fastidiosus]WEH10269.1 succinylglutamate desuccinylase/aspartoacylase family protein [Alicyclobacillus fastidiosus]
MMTRYLLVDRPTTPYYVIKGRSKGPIVLVTAGIHGTEIAGVLAAEQLRHIQLKRGTLIIVPIVNVRAYRQRARGNPDLNRTFPHRSSDRPKIRLSRNLFALAHHFQPTWCIDLHEANGLYLLDNTKLGQTLIVYPNQETYRTAKKIIVGINHTITKGTRKFSVKQGKLRGSFRTAVGSVLGSHAITVETSMQQPRAVRVKDQVRIVHALLREIGLI